MKPALLSARRVDVRKDALTMTRLERFLETSTPRIVTCLQRTWKDQQQAITYHELQDAIEAGEISEGYLDEWRQQYSRLVTTELAPSWEEATQQAYTWAAEKYGVTATDDMLPILDDYLSTRAAEFVTNVSEGQIDAMRAMVRRAAMSTDITNAELARMIRPTIGLTKRDANAVANYYERLRASGYGPKAARQRQSTYAARLHRKRAETIADYEMSRAYNSAGDMYVREAQNQGLLGKVRKRWITEGTERVCDVCRSLNGKVVDMDDEFHFLSKHMFHSDYPPIHPHCHCDVLYEEEFEAVVAGEGEQLMTMAEIEAWFDH